MIKKIIDWLKCQWQIDELKKGIFALLVFVVIYLIELPVQKSWEPIIEEEGMVGFMRLILTSIWYYWDKWTIPTVLFSFLILFQALHLYYHFYNKKKFGSKRYWKGREDGERMSRK